MEEDFLGVFFSDEGPLSSGSRGVSDSGMSSYKLELSMISSVKVGFVFLVLDEEEDRECFLTFFEERPVSDS